MKVVTLVGTRPEIIRLACLLPLLDERCDHTLVHTGQNYDYELSKVFFEDLDLRDPDVFLDCDTTNFATTVGDVISKTAEVLLKVQPDAFLVLGDTNSCVGAYAARRLGISVFHMEAGNRCWDMNVPEETNRRLVDHISDINICYTEHARRNLLREGMHPRSVYVCGSPMYEVLGKFKERIDASTVIEKLQLQRGKYLVASLHREENVDSQSRFARLVQSLHEYASSASLPVVMSVHPRTKKRLAELPSEFRSTFTEMKPLGFHDYNALQMNSYCVFSDSGTIAEESAILNFPGVTPRVSIERPEALDAGTISLAGDSTQDLAAAIAVASQRIQQESVPPFEYEIPDFSRRVLNLVQSISPVRRTWDGMREKNFS